MSDGRVIRLHQEDFCQAFGVLPENKYVEYGGFNFKDVSWIVFQSNDFLCNVSAKKNLRCIYVAKKVIWREFGSWKAVA